MLSAESSTVQRFFIAVSTTADPTGTFFIYNLNVTFFVNDFFDFPQLGMDQDAVLFTANIFNGPNFHGADFFAVAKARLYNGLGFSVPVFTGLVVKLRHRQSCATKTPRRLESRRRHRGPRLANTPQRTPAKVKICAHGTGQYYCTVLLGSAECPSTWNDQAVGRSDSRFVNASTQSGNDLWQTHTIALGSFPAPKFYRSILPLTQSLRAVLTSQAPRRMTSTHPSPQTTQAIVS